MQNADKPGQVFRGTPEAEEARRVHERGLPPRSGKEAVEIISAQWLRELCMRHGVDDVGFVEVSRPGLGQEGENARFMMPEAKTMISLVRKINKMATRVPARTPADVTWKLTTNKLDEIAAELCSELDRHGISANSAPTGFPLELAPSPGKGFWLISHKIVATEAGMGHMGVNRNVIHPEFGNFILLETIIIDRELDEYNKPLDYNPCFDCNLCVAACPVNAIHKDEDFDFFACMGHNYHEFPQMTADWVETLTAEGGPAAYRAKFRREETIVIAQGLEFNPTYRSGYCVAVCPAGDEHIGDYLADPAKHRQQTLMTLRKYPEPVYVTSGTRAEQRALRNPYKWIRYIDFKPDLSTPANFALGLRHMFKSPGPDAPRRVVSFRFPDGTVTAVLAKGKLSATTEPAQEAADAVVTTESVNYITILHKHLKERMRHESATITVDGDAAAFEQLIACLD